MRVRPFFWAFLATVCVGVLIFAGVVAKNQLYPLQAQIQQVVSNPAGLVVVHLHLADTENQPIDHAMITPDATMPAMGMVPQVITLRALGQGNYQARFALTMTGLWQLAFHVTAPGFLPAHQVVSLMVVS